MLITTTKKIILLVSFILLAAVLVRSGIQFIQAGVPFHDAYMLAVLAFLPCCYFIFRFKAFKTTVLWLLIYLVLATFNIISWTFENSYTNVFIKIGEFQIITPRFNGSAFGMLLIYSLINIDTLINIYLDYKESKK